MQALESNTRYAARCPRHWELSWRTSIALATQRTEYSPLANLPEFTASERELVAKILRQRFGHPVALETAETELRIEPEDDGATSCPTYYWRERGVDFVLCRVASERYRAGFFGADTDTTALGADDREDLRDCLLTLLRLQSDSEQRSAGIASGVTAADLAGDHGGRVRS